MESMGVVVRRYYPYSLYLLFLQHRARPYFWLKKMFVFFVLLILIDVLLHAQQ